MIPFYCKLIYSFRGIFTQIISFDLHSNSMKKEGQLLFASFYSWENYNPESMVDTGQLYTKLYSFSFFAYGKTTFPKIPCN